MKKSSFIEGLIKSFLFHVILLVVIIVNHWLPWGQVDLNEITVLQNAIRVDLVAMPDKTLKELKMVDLSKLPPKPPKEKEEVKEEVKEEKKSEPEAESKAKNEYQVEEKKSSLQDLLKDFSKKEVKVAPKKVTEKSDAKDTSELSKLVIAGNRLSEGSQLTGDQIAENLSPIDRYGQRLLAKLRPYWRLPANIKELGLKGQIRVFIGPNGALLRTEVTISSGLDEFDQRALETFQQAAPFPAPDQEIADLIKFRGLPIAFPFE